MPSRRSALSWSRVWAGITGSPSVVVIRAAHVLVQRQRGLGRLGRQRLAVRATRRDRAEAGGGGGWDCRCGRSASEWPSPACTRPPGVRARTGAPGAAGPGSSGSLAPGAGGCPSASDGALWVGRRTALRSRLVGLFRARRFQKPIDLGGGPNADAHPVRQAAGCHGTNDQAMLLQLSRECSATCDICEDEIGMRHVIVPRAEVLENAAKHACLAALSLR